MPEFKYPDGFHVDPPKPVAVGWAQPVIEDELAKKEQFAQLLANGVKPFEAACSICGQNTSLALWIAQNWINDPIVKDLRETVDTGQGLLDRDQLARKLLAMAEEKTANNLFYVLEGKDRLKALEIYAKIKKFLDDDATPSNKFVYNSMTIKLVEPERKAIEPKTIDNQSEISNPNSSIKLKLVG